MNRNHESYPLPTETMPSLDLKHHLEDLQQIRNFMESRGVATHNTRLDRYARFYEEAEVHGVRSSFSHTLLQSISKKEKGASLPLAHLHEQYHDKPRHLVVIILQFPAISGRSIHFSPKA